MRHACSQCRAALTLERNRWWLDVRQTGHTRTFREDLSPLTWKESLNTGSSSWFLSSFPSHHFSSDKSCCCQSSNLKFGHGKVGLLRKRRSRFRSNYTSSGDCCSSCGPDHLQTSSKVLSSCCPASPAYSFPHLIVSCYPSFSVVCSVCSYQSQSKP